jgi:hypothetical protein
MNCEARKGFLTMSNCENPAARACANCGRMLCPTHLAPPDFSMCLDCAATAAQTPPDQPQTEGEYDDVWAHGYRSSYYASSGYSPSRYDQQDVSSFRDRGGNDAVDDDLERGGFGAS